MFPKCKFFPNELLQFSIFPNVKTDRLKHLEYFGNLGNKFKSRSSKAEDWAFNIRVMSQPVCNPAKPGYMESRGVQS